MMDLRHAAKLMPLISAMHGPKDKVTQYPCGVVLRELKADADASLLEGWTGHEYGKIMDAEAKSRRRGKK